MSQLKLLTGALLFGVTLSASLSAQISSEVDTKNWKTYRNETMGFEVMHPGAWHVRTSSGTMEGISIDTPRQTGKPIVSVQFAIQRKINPEGLSISEWYAGQLKQAKSPPPIRTGTIIGGRPAIRHEYVSTFGRHITFFVSLSKTDIFQALVIQPVSQAQLDQTHEKILSTIKFLN